MAEMDSKVLPPNSGERLGPCPVCGREMIAGPSVDRHHWQPKSWGGREAQPLHLICHRKLHTLFSEKELATTFDTPEAVRQHPQMQIFIQWVRRRPPEFIDRHKKPGLRK
jgi:hypothetical protein